MRNRIRLFSALALAASLPCLFAQRAPNANPVYEQLRALEPGAEVVAVKDFYLKRDAATFAFTSGSFAFYPAVDGKITGAVFRGQGHLHLVPPTDLERRNLDLLNGSEIFDEDFDEVVLRFTDATAAELKKAATGPGQPDSGFDKAARDFHTYQRDKLYRNIDLRILEDVLSPSQSGYFFAAIHGKKDAHLFLTIDPHGAPWVGPEEVSLMSENDWGRTQLAAFHASAGSGQPVAAANDAYRIDTEDLDVTIERSGFLSSVATAHIVAGQDGVSVIPIGLYPTLRVSKVETDAGDPLDFVQEDKDEDADFGVLLAKPLNKGESVTLRIAYGGKDVVFSEGGANYYPIARNSWYPSSYGGDYTTYDMRFHVPKGLQLIATGTKSGETTEGKLTTSEWKTNVPVAMVGFSLGQFKMKEAAVDGSLSIDAYANTSVPDAFKRSDMLADIAHPTAGAPLGNPDNASQLSLSTLDTVSMLPGQLSQAEVAANIYLNYFGPLPFSKIAVTQQFACTYGQSWPMMVYIPICAFLSPTQRHFLGLDDQSPLAGDHFYWATVTPHEVAHQWWGQTVGFRSYRDQWMSEGFADFSASLFLQATQPKVDQYLAFWRDERRRLTEKNQYGFRPIDVGPVTMGFRLSSPKAGWNIYDDLVYPKGAYIVHMLRMMMWSPQDGDARFKAMMHDFVDTYRLKPATTEDFKAMVEKHMGSWMDLDGNHRMDWFFNDYVYGTELPAYQFEGNAAPNDKGWTLHFTLTQSGVSPSFKNIVPLYVEFTNGKVMQLGSIPVAGSTTVDRTLQLPKMPAPIKQVSINYYADLLCIQN